MPTSVGPRRNPSLSKKNRALLAATLLTLTFGPVGLQAQPDLAAIRTRAEQGDPEALNALANAYANGAGVPQSFAEALRLYQQAAERGLAAAQFNFGMMHELGRGTAVNQATAFRWYLKAAEQGFAPAQFNVGNMYANGTGVAQDYFEAALWFRQAAERQVPEAQYNLALAYELGRGVAKDEPAAQRWYRAAANQKYARAQYNLALMLEEGRGGPDDPVAAVEYYRAAAAQNFAPAQNNLGILLAEGRGAPANLVEAYTWLALAVENGTKPTGRDIVAQQLTPAQRAEADTALARLRTQLGMRPTTAVASAPATTPPPASSARPAVGSSSPAPEIVALNTRVVNAETEAERLRAENARLTEATQVLMRDKAALEQRMAAAPAPNASTTAGASAAATADLPLPQLAANDPRIAKLVADNARLNDEVKRSTIELTQLNRQLRSVQEKQGKAEEGAPAAATPDTARVAELARQVETLAAEKAALERRLAESSARATPPAEAEGLPALRTQLGEVVEQLGAARRETQALRTQANAAQQREAASREAASTLQSQLAEAQTKLTAAQQAGNTAATQRLAEANTQRDALAKENAALEQQVAQLAGRVNSLIGEREQWARGGPGGQGDREAVTRLNLQLENAGQTIAELNTKNESLLKDLEVARQSAAAALAAQAAAAKAAPSDAMRLEMQTLQEQVRRLEGQLEDDRKASARDLATLASQLQNAREATRALAEANRALLQMKGAEDSSLKTELEQTNTRLAETERRLTQFRQAADSAKAEAEKARADHAALQARLGETSRAAEQHGSSVAELTGLNEKLSTEKAALEQQLAQARQAAEAARADVAELRGRVAAGERSAQGQAATFNSLSAANEQLQGQVKELSDQLGRLRADNARLAAAGDSSSVRAELADVRLKLTEAQKASEQQAASVAELTGANDKLSANVKELQTQLVALQGENARLVQSDQARQEAEQRAAGLTVAAAQLAASQRELVSARAEIARLSEAVQNLDRDRTTRLAQLQQENAAVSARLRQAQGTLDQIASAARLINGGNAPGVSSLAGGAPGIPVAAAPTPVSSSPLAAAPPQPRVHLVTEGDSLTRISVRYYGTSNRWQEIYDANRDVLRGENALRPGQRLRIP